MALDQIVNTGVIWEKLKTGVKWATIGFIAGYISSCTMNGCDADAMVKYDTQLIKYEKPLIQKPY